MHIWLAVGRALYTSRRRKEAHDCYVQALKRDPDNYELWFARAQVEEELAGRDEGYSPVESYKKFLALAPPELEEEIHYAELMIKRFY